MQKKTVWNTHQRVDDAVAEAHVAELAVLTSPVAIAVPSPHLPAIDEKHQVQVRSLLPLSSFLVTCSCSYSPTSLPRTSTRRTNAASVRSCSISCTAPSVFTRRY